MSTIRRLGDLQGGPTVEDGGRAHREQEALIPSRTVNPRCQTTQRTVTCLLLVFYLFTAPLLSEQFILDDGPAHR